MYTPNSSHPSSGAIYKLGVRYINISLIYLFDLKLGCPTNFCLLSCVCPGPEEVQRAKQLPFRSSFVFPTIWHLQFPSEVGEKGWRELQQHKSLYIACLFCAHMRGCSLHNIPGRY